MRLHLIFLKIVPLPTQIPWQQETLRSVYASFYGFSLLFQLTFLDIFSLPTYIPWQQGTLRSVYGYFFIFPFYLSDETLEHLSTLRGIWKERLFYVTSESLKISVESALDIISHM